MFDGFVVFPFCQIHSAFNKGLLLVATVPQHHCRLSNEISLNCLYGCLFTVTPCLICDILTEITSQFVFGRYTYGDCSAENRG